MRCSSQCFVRPFVSDLAARSVNSKVEPMTSLESAAEFDNAVADGENRAAQMSEGG